LRRLARRSLDGESLTPAEEAELQRHAEVCESLTARLLRGRAARAARQSRRTETPDSAPEVSAKVEQLASLLAGCAAGGCVVYTGAGVSTAADIPDYRGPDGLWTRLPRGALPRFCLPGVEAARPTFAHRFIAALVGCSESASSAEGPASSASSLVTPELLTSTSSSSVGLTASSVSSSSVVLPASSASSSSVVLPAASASSSSAGLPASSASSSSAGLPAASASSSSIGLPSPSAHEPAETPVQLPLVCHVVSQNCDGLHLRSGVPPSRLSELHGNVFVEACERCGRLVRRRFDVTERSRLRRHDTGRVCVSGGCTGRLLDTIVHFGEFGRRCTADRVYEWRAAEAAASRARLILCLGTSLQFFTLICHPPPVLHADLPPSPSSSRLSATLPISTRRQVLRHYPSLWPPDTPLAIVNLQATPFDRRAQVAIRADCDSVCRALAHRLRVRVPDYRPAADPLLAASEPLLDEAEKKLVSRPDIVVDS
uniref:Regulatory protein SIR2 homolog 7 n=1 Tax=Macrostomum lignano TaxID=282301 RepID=A0A1I8I3T0_9PLAT